LLGLIRAGWGGAIAAFIAFTMPSAALLFAFAYLMPRLASLWGQALFHGLKLAAVAVVAQGLFSMAQRLTPDLPRRLIAVCAVGIVLGSDSPISQLVAIVLGALLGYRFCRGIAVDATNADFELPYSRRTGIVLLGSFAALLIGALAPRSTESTGIWIAAEFYRVGALVFGGGHVVLPLLEHTLVPTGKIDVQEFLAGYGAAQAVPGPLFSIAAFLGAKIEGPGGLAGASIALLAIFLPGLLLAAGALPWWREISSREVALGTVAGVNAAVVGLLAAALYDPLWTSAIHSLSDLAIALVGFALMGSARFSALTTLAWCVLASVARAYIGSAL
jgi:chromate transporter